ncbi:MAG: hypothetical protein A3B86_04070 [Candidatus Yanofskybacteria bacterium RIFCSPHIGHO2_02_FULL_38_22b]|uniref:Polyphosphate kinase-2-related domain-containing protein n=1 Tax=Candidatus Yanofskybacteria bacterium RIFCSPHIGHO2_02_FULL_38_22b TaxID=1802673 RepID=A0A1F8F0P7_9BACT|nr:MAG: hypothetical protein A2816_01840 [Candidatus Yanofskybacteria bacterium RIFCSPHIGHO2_01_FULL_39_44]OGN06268.1 MAG: hypothetical protein A3B86_04070 [Candidatus Yanofskybacteria bacterium RIFCSPHIGHO2_02_FULL_38_22b]OGN19688.1 MAG: hypothetical protein A2910_03805 [Candidatus Yanofskybacteria bacterium RIFCSPLOWO2_01_FULL_39_28]
MNLSKFLVKPRHKVNLNKYDPGFTAGWDKKDARVQLDVDTETLAKFQDMMFAQKPRIEGFLAIFQARDGAGKDSIAEAVMSKVHHAGCHFTPFGVPTEEDLDYGYLHRHMLTEPKRGHFSVWIRSHLEEVLIAKIRPEVLAKQHLPKSLKDEHIWKRRYEEIRNYHQYLAQNGFIVVIIFLHISQEEQWKQLHERVVDTTKYHKSSIKDVHERQILWNEYQKAVEKMLFELSTKHAHAYVVPADHRWFAKMLVARIFVQELEKLDLCYPKPTGDRKKEIAETRRLLEEEKKSHRK